ncbi:MAG: HEAT repeat domain-containing protein [Candidatus Ozemobacteraceae bacterium]
MNVSALVSDRLSAIQEVGAHRLESAVPLLIEALNDPNPDISAAAASSLGNIGDPRAIDPLLELVRKNDERMLSEAPQEVLEENASQAKNVSPSDHSTTENPEINPFRYKEMTLFRIDLFSKEYFQADGIPIPRKELVVKGLKDDNQQIRKIAAKIAIGLEDPDLVPSLIETMQNLKEEESVRYLAAEALGGMHDGRIVDPLIAALQDQNVAVRYSAATALSRCREEKALDALVSAISDPNEFVRSSVAYALGNINNAKSSEALLAALDDEQDIVRFSVAKALGTIGGEAVLEGLKQRMETSGGRFKVTVVEALGQIKDDRAFEILRTALRDEDSEIVYRSSLALMNQDSLDALDDLIEASRRIDQELMDLAENSSKSAEPPVVTGEKNLAPTESNP